MSYREHLVKSSRAVNPVQALLLVLAEVGAVVGAAGGEA